MSKKYYNPNKRYTITFYIKNTNQTISSNMNNVQDFIERYMVKRFKKWVILPTNDNTPDVFIRRSSISFYTVQRVKK